LSFSVLVLERRTEISLDARESVSAAIDGKAGVGTARLGGAASERCKKESAP